MLLNICGKYFDEKNMHLKWKHDIWSVIFDQFNASLLNKCANFFQKILLTQSFQQ